MNFVLEYLAFRNSNMSYFFLFQFRFFVCVCVFKFCWMTTFARTNGCDVVNELECANQAEEKWRFNISNTTL